MKDKLAKLIDVKSLVTLGMVACYIAVILMDRNINTDFQTLMTMILGFYFGTQATKKD